MRRVLPAQRRGFAAVLVIIVLALAFGAMVFTYIRSQKTKQEQVKQDLISRDPYYTWKTYDNRRLGFSVRYPKEWFVREYGDYAANFSVVDPKEATPGAIKVRFNKLSEKIDLQTFDRIYDLKPDATMYEPLDVRSVITKARSFDIGGNKAVEYSVDRIFSALEGPKTEYSHAYEVAKGDNVLKFISSDQDKEGEQRTDGIFQQMIASLKF